MLQDKFLIAIMSHDLYFFPIVNRSRTKRMGVSTKNRNKFIHIFAGIIQERGT